MLSFYPKPLVEPDTELRPALIVSWQEIVLVMAVMLGPGALFGAYYGLSHPPGAFYLLFNNRFFLINGSYQSAVLAGFLFYLHRRGWKPADFRIRIGFTSSLRGLELLLFTYFGFFVLTEITRVVLWATESTSFSWVANLFVPHHVPLPPGGVHLSWLVLIVFTVVNAFYEELVYLGYGFNLWAAKYGSRAAFLLSVLARLAVHSYQGTEHVLPIAVWAVIFGVWYRYHRKVWPLILAHLMIDLISFSLLKETAGSH